MTVVYELRYTQDYFAGKLTSAAAISDTTLTSTEVFPALPSDFSTTKYMPLVLHNPATGISEKVWVTAHTASSSSVTVVRGREGTTAQAWPNGTQVVCAPTVRDGLPIYSTANVPTDLHAGTRFLHSDSNQILMKSYASGFIPASGFAIPSLVGKRFDNTDVPANMNPYAQMGHRFSVAPSSGLITVTFPQAFPNGIVGGWAWSIDQNLFVGSIVTEQFTATTMKLRPVQHNGSPPGVASVGWVAIGY